MHQYDSFTVSLIYTLLPPVFMRESRTEKHRKKLELLLDRFYELDTDKLVMILSYGCGDKLVVQAINIIFKGRGIKATESFKEVYQ